MGEEKVWGWECKCGSGLPINVVPHVEYQKLQSELAEAKAEALKWKGNFTIKQGIIEELMKDVAELEQSRELVGRLEEALKFYANKENWTGVGQQHFSAIRSKDFPIGDSDADFDHKSGFYHGGKRARAALELIGGKK